MLRGLRRVVRRELRIIFSHRIYLFCTTAAPLLCFILFATLMDEGLPTGLPVAMVDADNTPLSQRITRRLDAMQQIDIVKQCADIGEATRAMRREDIYALYYIPRGTARRLIEGERPILSYYLNYSYLVAGSLTYRDMYITSLLANAAVGEATLTAQGATELQATNFVQPVVIETNALGNPWLSYAVYLNNTLFPGVVSLLIFILTAYSVTQEIKYRTGAKWLQAAGNNILVAVAGKLLPQTLLFSLTAIFYNIFLYKYLHYPLNTPLSDMIAASLLLIVASQSLGLFLASALPSPRWAMSIASLWGVVSFSISGFSFPIEGMSGSIEAATNLFPLRHYFMIYSNKALLGYPTAYSWVHYAALLTFCLLPLPLMKRLKYALKNYRYIE
ncbi:MAG: ABC transporter permease [Bacteroidaceae bacterium]|nr:ABC transporter permease [Bacteroidaceae bacterium]